MNEAQRAAEPAPAPVGPPPLNSPRPRNAALAILVGALRALPNLLVLALLGSLAYWGHHTGWTIPRFSELAAGQSEEPDDWCVEHCVPESICVECKPEQFPPLENHGWCREHGVHQCPHCHPDVIQSKDPPKPTAGDRARIEEALALRPRAENNSRCELYQRRIQFASEKAMADAGVDIALVEERAMSEVVTAPGEIAFDQTLVAYPASRAAGTVWRVEKKVGDSVASGEILALVDANEVGKAKAEFLSASVQLDLKTKELASMQGVQEVVKARDIRETKAAVQEAKVRLRGARQTLINLGINVPADDLAGLSDDELATRLQFLGLPTFWTAKLDPATTTANLLPIRSPIDGVIVERMAVLEKVVAAGESLFMVADPRRMWMMLDVRQEDALDVAIGQRVDFRSDGGNADASGRVTWISSSADEKTRTVKIRADLENDAGKLRSGAFGTGRIVLREDAHAAVVPNSAVQWDGSCHVLFVRDKHFFEADASKMFHTRTVRIGARDADYTEILVGAVAGEVVAAKGSGILRSELLKNNLGAG